jgi:Vitamin K-dependent gamma-carboxylase
VRSRLGPVLDAWNAFWFEPVSTAPVVVFRIAFGVLTLAWSLTALPVLSPFYTKTGILPDQPAYNGQLWGAWGLLDVFTSRGAVVALIAVMIVASICMILGVLPQLAAAVLFVGLMSLDRRNPYVINAGDWLLRILALYLIFAPTGAALSVLQYLRGRERFWTFPLRAPWAMRLMQIQFSVVYFIALWTKVQGTTWNNGTAVSYALRIKDLERFPVPSFVTHSLVISNLLTYGTLVIELGLAILVWNRRLRPWVLLLGLSLHLGIEYSIRVGFYGLAIMAMYLLWVPSARLEAAALAVRRPLERSRVKPAVEVAPRTASSTTPR